MVIVKPERQQCMGLCLNQPIYQLVCCFNFMETPPFGTDLKLETPCSFPSSANLLVLIPSPQMAISSFIIPFTQQHWRYQEWKMWQAKERRKNVWMCLRLRQLDTVFNGRFVMLWLINKRDVLMEPWELWVFLINLFSGALSRAF